MPKDLANHLKETGAVLWDTFAWISMINKFDVKDISSQSLGIFETGLTVLPPVKDLIVHTPVEKNDSEVNEGMF